MGGHRKPKGKSDLNRVKVPLGFSSLCLKSADLILKLQVTSF